MGRSRESDLKGKQLVADVVLNRMYDPRFPDTISDVIYQQGQFYREGDPRLTKAFYNVSDECFEAVCQEALGDGRIDPRVFSIAQGISQDMGRLVINMATIALIFSNLNHIDICGLLFAFVVMAILIHTTK